LFVRMCTVRPKRKQTKDTVGSVPVLTTTCVGQLYINRMAARKDEQHGVAESNWILFSCGETLVIFDWADRTIAQHDYIIN